MAFEYLSSRLSSAASSGRWGRLSAAICSVMLAATAHAGPIAFYTVSSISSSTASSDFFPVNNLIQGAGTGFSANAPHDRLSTDTWVTAACNYPCDYFARGMGAPVLTIDLGQNQALSLLSLWGYGHPNSASRFTLAFATESEGVGAFGTSITYTPTFAAAMQTLTMQEFDFSQVITARYVRMTLTDNFFTAADPWPGGDRVGLSEVALGNRLPEPGSVVLAGACLLGAAAARRRRRS